MHPRPDPAPTRAPAPVRVALRRGDVAYLVWTQALERPVLPFLASTFTGLALVGMLGVWPAARLYALAALVPLLGYLGFVALAARLLWRRAPGLAAEREIRFDDAGYRVRSPSGTDRVAWGDVARVLESRRGLYLERRGGATDVLPKAATADPDATAAFLAERVPRWRRSTWL